MRSLAACLVAIVAAGDATDALAGAPTAAAQDKPAGKPDDKAPPKKDEKKPAVEEWGTDYEKALATAKNEKKVVLAVFTCSDKSGWCRKLKAEIFDTKDFQEWSKKSVVLLEVDFPQEKKQPDEVKKQNQQLMEKYKKEVDGYPTVLFLDAKGEVVGKMRYQEGGPSKWTKDADKIVAKAKR